MLATIFNGLKTLRRRPTLARPSRRLSLPAPESMEDRHLLSTYMLIDSPSITEGTGGTSELTFTVTLTSPSTDQVSVNYRTIDRSAKAGSDYKAASGSLMFSPGQTTKTVTIDVINDAAVEQTESFYMMLSGATNARIIKSIGVGMIVDDDTPIDPELSINDVRMTRGFSGHKYMTFTVSLNTTLTTPVTVTAYTQNVTAIAGEDYEAKTEKLTFAPGERTKQFTVKIFSSPITIGPDEVFFVYLTDASVPLGKGAGAGVLRYGA